MAKLNSCISILKQPQKKMKITTRLINVATTKL